MLVIEYGLPLFLRVFKYGGPAKLIRYSFKRMNLIEFYFCIVFLK